MHELSIAEAIFDAARRALPPLSEGTKVIGVSIVAGPLRALDRESLRFAWQSVTRDSDWRDVEIELRVLPWILACPMCGRRFESDDPFAACDCGSEAASPNGSDTLQIVAFQVSDPPAAASLLQGESR